MLLTLTLTLCAAGYGSAVGALLPRPVRRFAVEREQQRAVGCPAGHPLPASWRGWVGPAGCAHCGSHDSPVDVDVDVNVDEAGDGIEARDRNGDSGAEGTAGVYGPGAAWLITAGAAVCASLAVSVGPRPELAVWLLITPFGLLLAAVDIRVRRLPDALTLPLAAATAALLGVASIFPGAGGSWVRALLGGVVLAGGYFVLFLVHSRGFGFGDVKLALTVGVALGWYGWQVLLAGAFLGFLLHATYGVALILAGRAGRKTALPFGPFMLTGAALLVTVAGASA